jgi:8-oxo-dGTP pyrophosphatase MutT (NUDIX family)
MANRDGNGWKGCGQGHRHWGRYGAAGLLVSAPCPDRAGGKQTCVLLQRRSWWGNYGGAWGPPGGAQDSHESVVAAALREAEEECAVPAGAVRVRGIFRDDHGGWSYHTVIATAPEPFPVRAMGSETSKVAWVAAEDVAALDLHPSFAQWWPVLREALPPVTIVVDGANVVGSRPDGWWRDRAGAARRLRDQLSGLAAEGLAALPEAMDAPALQRWFPEFVLVVEGAARSIAGAHAAGARGSRGAGSRGAGSRGAGSRGAGSRASRGSREGRGLSDSVGSSGVGSSGGGSDGVGSDGWEPDGGGTDGGGTDGVGADGGAVAGAPGRRVRVVAAPGSGDDTIAELARDLEGRRLVVTADRGLRERCVAAGASVTGPSWLLGLV